MNRLTVRAVSLPAPWVRKGGAETIEFLDWEIDGVSLRDRYEGDTEMTLLQDEEWMQQDRAEAIARLRGEVTTPPTYVPVPTLVLALPLAAMSICVEPMG